MIAPAARFVKALPRHGRPPDGRARSLPSISPPPAGPVYPIPAAQPGERAGKLFIALLRDLCYTPHTRGCSSSVELRLPKPIRWVRLPSSAPTRRAACRAALFCWSQSGWESNQVRTCQRACAFTSANTGEYYYFLFDKKKMQATPIIRSRKGRAVFRPVLFAFRRPQAERVVQKNISGDEKKTGQSKSLPLEGKVPSIARRMRW